MRKLSVSVFSCLRLKFSLDKQILLPQATGSCEQQTTRHQGTDGGATVWWSAARGLYGAAAH